MSQSNELQTEADLRERLQADRVTVFVTFRGDWCPFCRSYLSKLERSYAELHDHGIELFGVSIDDQRKQAALKSKLGVSFEFLTDTARVFHETHGVHLGKDKGNGPFLQPGVFIYAGHDKVFEWIQTPRLLNMGGAMSRIAPDEVARRALEAQANLATREAS